MVDAYESGLRQLGKTHGDPGAVTFAKAIVMAATQGERDPSGARDRDHFRPAVRRRISVADVEG